MQTMKPPKAPPTKTRLVVTPESSLEFGDILGSGAFGTVHEVCLSVYVLRMFCPSTDSAPSLQKPCCGSNPTNNL